MESNNKEELTPILTMGNHGENVWCFRRMRDIKQPELAKLVGVSERTMTNLESQAVIEDKYLIKIATALNVTVEDIKYFNCKTSEIKIQNFKDNAYNNEPNSNQITNVGITIENYDKLIEKLISEKDKNAELKAENAVLKFRLEEN